MLHAADYAARVDFANGGCLVGSVGYPDYPVSFERFEGWWGLFEGHVYGGSQAERKADLEALGRKIFAPGEDPQLAVREWIRTHDGDYVAVLGREDGTEVVVFTDVLGRLPLYLSQEPRRLVIGRECKFPIALNLNPGVIFDRLAWAQELWVGYPLGERTLFQGISRMPGALFLRARRMGDRVSVERQELWRWDFDEKDSPSRPVDKYAAELVDTFVDGIHKRRERIGAVPFILALSGGHDSRSVAAALKQADVPFDAVTMRAVDASGRRGWADARLAEHIAETVQTPWHLIDLEEVGAEVDERLVQMKDGLNYIGISFILPFLDELVRRYSRQAVYVTGDGGDKLFPDLRPECRIRTVQDLVAAVSTAHACMPADLAESILELPPGTLLEELTEHLSRYPETELAQRAVRFQFLERGRKWLFEGEDRNRFFLWQVSPFYSLAMFEQAMRVPDQLKVRHKLYRSFQMRLSSVLAQIPHADVGLPIASRQYPWKLRAMALGRRLPRGLKSRIKVWMREEGHSFRIPERALDYLEGFRREQRQRSFMNPDPVVRALPSLTYRQYLNWWTLVLLEQRWSGDDIST
jgi:asparagine synthase (glutamine-hydrolysing)